MLAAMGVVVVLAAAAQAAVVGVFPVAGPSPDTLVFRDYNSGTDQNVSYSPGGGSAPTQAIAGGASAWTYGGVVSDPKIIYNDGNGTWDYDTYPWVRMRYKQSRSGAGTPQVWENPAQGGEAVTFAQSTTFTEGHGDPDSAANASAPTTPNGSGYRIDPVSSSLANDVFTVDYVLIDRFQTIGLGEWDAAGDQNGWAVANASGVGVANGVLSGTSTGDTRMENTTLINADLYTIIEIGLSTASSSLTESQLFWGPNGAFAEARSVKFSGTDGAFITYVLDMGSEPTWAGTNMRIRLDPVQGDEAFAVDYVRLRTDTTVPEPATLSLLALGGLALARRKRR